MCMQDSSSCCLWVLIHNHVGFTGQEPGRDHAPSSPVVNVGAALAELWCHVGQHCEYSTIDPCRSGVSEFSHAIS